jgi:hypothetical protein
VPLELPPTQTEALSISTIWADANERVWIFSDAEMHRPVEDALKSEYSDDEEEEKNNNKKKEEEKHKGKGKFANGAAHKKAVSDIDSGSDIDE